MALLLAFIIAMAITMALIPVLMRYASAMHVMDEPGERRVHTVAIPRIGGIAMVVGTVVSLVVWLPHDNVKLIAYIAGAAVILAFGVWDDRANLPPIAKIGGQLIAILIVVFLGGVSIDSYTLDDTYALPQWIGVPLTVVFILGVTNAINLSDGLDGLAGGTTLLTAVAIAMLARLSGDSSVAIAAMALAGAILGFLRFNTYPARIFMGDGGSQFLGFTVAVLTVLLTQDESVSLSTALPVMLLGLPVVDTVMVMAQRAREGQPLFKGDKRHIHHKLLALGFDHYEAVVLIYASHLCFFVLGWFMRYEPDPYIFAAFAALAAFFVSLLILAGRVHWQWRRPEIHATSSSALGRLVVWLGDAGRLPRWALRATGAGVIVYLAVAASAAQPSRDVGFLAVAIVIAAAVTLVMPGDRMPWLARAMMCVVVSMAVYLDHQVRDNIEWVHAVKLTALPVIAFGVLLRMRLSVRRFEITTLDVLMILIALIVPNLPGIEGPSNLGFSILKLVVLLYAIELCIDQGDRSRRAMSAGALMFGTWVFANAFA